MIAISSTKLAKSLDGRAGARLRSTIARWPGRNGREILPGLLLNWVVAGAAFAATGTKRSGVTLTLWHNYGTGGNAVATNNLVAAFQKQNPNITIKVVSQPGGNYFQLLQAAWIAHTAPDLSVQWTGLFDVKYQNQLLNLKQYFTTADLSKVNGARWSSAKVTGPTSLIVAPAHTVRSLSVGESWTPATRFHATGPPPSAAVPTPADQRHEVWRAW